MTRLQDDAVVQCTVGVLTDSFSSGADLWFFVDLPRLVLDGVIVGMLETRPSVQVLLEFLVAFLWLWLCWQRRHTCGKLPTQSVLGNIIADVEELAIDAVVVQ